MDRALKQVHKNNNRWQQDGWNTFFFHARSTLIVTRLSDFFLYQYFWNSETLWKHQWQHIAFEDTSRRNYSSYEDWFTHPRLLLTTSAQLGSLTPTAALACAPCRWNLNRLFASFLLLFRESSFIANTWQESGTDTVLGIQCREQGLCCLTEGKLQTWKDINISLFSLDSLLLLLFEHALS